MKFRSQRTFRLERRGPPQAISDIVKDRLTQSRISTIYPLIADGIDQVTAPIGALNRKNRFTSTEVRVGQWTISHRLSLVQIKKLIKKTECLKMRSVRHIVLGHSVSKR